MAEEATARSSCHLGVPGVSVKRVWGEVNWDMVEDWQVQREWMRREAAERMGGAATEEAEEEVMGGIGGRRERGGWEEEGGIEGALGVTEMGGEEGIFKLRFEKLKLKKSGYSNDGQ